MPSRRCRPARPAAAASSRWGTPERKLGADGRGMTGSLLLVGADSESGAATARHLGALGVPVLATTRRPERIAADRPYLDLAEPLDGWTPPPGIEAACIFAAVARLQTCDSDPAGSSYVNVAQIVSLA